MHKLLWTTCAAQQSFREWRFKILQAISPIVWQVRVSHLVRDTLNSIDMLCVGLSVVPWYRQDAVRLLSPSVLTLYHLSIIKLVSKCTLYTNVSYYCLFSYVRFLYCFTFLCFLRLYAHWINEEATFLLWKYLARMPSWGRTSQGTYRSCFSFPPFRSSYLKPILGLILEISTS